MVQGLRGTLNAGKAAMAPASGEERRYALEVQMKKKPPHGRCRTDGCNYWAGNDGRCGYCRLKEDEMSVADMPDAPIVAEFHRALVKERDADFATEAFDVQITEGWVRYSEKQRNETVRVVIPREHIYTVVAL